MRLDIHDLNDDAGLRAAWPLVSQLRTELDEARFVEQALRQMRHGYRATLLRQEGMPRAYAGWRVQESLVHARHLYVDDLVTDAASRSRGHGKALLDWLKAEGLRLGCTRLQLDSGTQRRDAHAFYLREGLRIESFHFGIALG